MGRWRSDFRLLRQVQERSRRRRDLLQQVLDTAPSSRWHFAAATTIVDTNKVSAWGDLIGSRHATQTTADRRPVLGASGIVFDGVDDRLRMESFTGASLQGQQWEWIHIYSGATFAAGLDGGATPRLYLTHAAFSYDTNNTLPITPASSALQAFSYVRDGSHVRVRRNNVELGAAEQAIYVTGSAAVITHGIAAAFCAAHTLRESLLWLGRTLTSVERAVVQAYAAAEHGVPP